jgi:hypothetical protein
LETCETIHESNLKMVMITSITSIQLYILCLPTIITILFVAAAQPKDSQGKVFEFPEYDYVESPKNVRKPRLLKSTPLDNDNLYHCNVIAILLVVCVNKGNRMARVGSCM